jgi:hypothetical protein
VAPSAVAIDPAHRATISAPSELPFIVERLVVDAALGRDWISKSPSIDAVSELGSAKPQPTGASAGRFDAPGPS